MKNKLMLFCFAILSIPSCFAQAASSDVSSASVPSATSTVAAKQTKVKKMGVRAKPKDSRLKTDVSFNDQEVGGKYQLPFESLSVVENEKSIDALIGVRKDFKDRDARAKELR